MILMSSAVGGDFMLSKKNDMQDRRNKYRPNLENMMLSLFSPNSSPLFNQDKISAQVLEKFIQSNEVFNASYDFVLLLKRIWKKQNPEKGTLEFLHISLPDADLAVSTSTPLGGIDLEKVVTTLGTVADSSTKNTMKNTTPPEPETPIQNHQNAQPEGAAPLNLNSQPVSFEYQSVFHLEL